MGIKMRILHITAHMGGGAGNAISNMLAGEKENTHRLILLEKPQKRQFVDLCLEMGLPVLEAPGRTEVMEEVQAADVVVVHWWHHPLMCGFLADFPFVPVRIVLWAHVSGCTYPVLEERFALMFDRIFLTTPFSYENQEWSSDGRKQIMARSRVIYGLGRIKFGENPLPSHSLMQYRGRARSMRGDNFVIGYVGTLNQSKLHPRFPDFCREVLKRIPDACFLMVGELAEADWLLEELRAGGMEESFLFTGYRTDVEEQLAQMDVFAYPLNPQHFGTTENVILEAMAAGLPVVALEQNTEKYIVTDGEDGFLVRSPAEYGEAVYELYRDPQIRRRMGERAAAKVLDRYDTGKNRKAFLDGLCEIMDLPGHNFPFRKLCGSRPYEWLLGALGREEREYFLLSLSGERDLRSQGEERIRSCPAILKGSSKSSIGHFARTYPEDRILERWRRLAEDCNIEGR